MTSSAALRRWASENVRPCWLDLDGQGRRVVLEAHPVTSLRESWFRSRPEWVGMFQPDGTVWLDSAGEHRYRKIRDLPDGSTAYERIEQ